MILEFKTTNKNTYGHRKYIAIDTDKKAYSIECPSMVISGIEIRSKDYKELIEKLNLEGFKKVERI